MAIVRCKQCGPPHGRTRNYVRSVRPIGYPNTSIICGIEECNNPGLVWLESAEICEYEEGARIFELPTASAKVMVE